jgi:hypothetical protein
MRRYHKSVYIPITDLKKLKRYTDKLNRLNWSYTGHCLDNLKYRVIDRIGLLLYIKGKRLDKKEIFEYYTDLQGNIIKAVYRLAYMKGLDIILVLAPDKKIITIYLNNSDDLHYTLRKEIYQKAII